MKRREFAVLVALAAGVVIWGAWALRLQRLAAAAGPELHTAAGYRAAVDLYLRHEWLRFDPASESIVPAFPPDSPAAEFYRSSYLQGDVAAFNGGQRSVFRVDNGRILGIDPNLHNLVLPFTVLRSWPGQLTFRPEAGRRGELVGGGVRIELAAPQLSLRRQERLPEARVRQTGGSGPETRVLGEAVNLIGEGGVFFGKTHLLGDALLFNHRGMTRGARITISGEEVPPGNHARMDSGDLLKLEWRLGQRGMQYALLWGAVLGEAPVISSQRAINGSWRRTPDHPSPRLAGPIVEALDNAVRRAPGVEPFDLALTLDARLQEAVERRLLTYARGLHRPGEPLFRAAVTVMDAKSGELLALASYPQAEDLTGDAAGSSEHLLRNHNFSRLPVGSVAKVMLTAAILQSAPYLADLKIPEYGEGEFDELLGITLNPPLRDHAVSGHGGMIDFERYLEKSSNKYAATLLTLATGSEANGLRPPAADADVPDRLAPGERFMLGGKSYDRRPGLRLPLVRDPGNPDQAACGLITTLEHEPHALALGELFGVPTSRRTLAAAPGREPRRRPGTGDDLIDTAAWMPLLTYLYGADHVPADHPFFVASPERTNLAYNLIDDYRRQYLSVILGGGSSTWTNVELCSVFSRLVTGQAVDPGLVRRIRPWEGRPIEPQDDRHRERRAPFGLADPARLRLVNALTLVAGPDGTAYRLASTVRDLDHALAAQGKALGYFSKTGSPDNTMFVPSRVARGVDALIAVGALHLDAAGRIAYRDAGAVGGEPREEGGAVDRTQSALLAHPEDLRLLRRAGISPRTVVRLCATWNRSRPEERRTHLGSVDFTIARGQLVHLRRVREVDTIGGDYVFTIGVYPQSARLPGGGAGAPPRIDVIHAQPERAFTVAIAIEGQGNGPEIAVPFAQQLIREVLADALRRPD